MYNFKIIKLILDKFLYIFFKMKPISKRNFGIFYAPEKGGVDFLLNNIMSDIILIEVGIANKSSK